MRKLLVWTSLLATSLMNPFVVLAAVSDNRSLNVPPPSTVPNVEIGQIISAVVGVLLIIAAVLAFLYLIIGGIQWITSGGDKAGMEAARNRITNAIVGLVIVAAAWAIMLLVGNFIGFNIIGGDVCIPTIEDPECKK